MAKRKLKNGTRTGSKRSVSTKPAPWNGDHGPKTEAAMADSKVVPIKDSPNRMAQRIRNDRVRELIPDLTMRQHQAAQALQSAFSACDMLSSGGALKEQVDSTPRPDAAVARQVDAHSALVYAKSALLRIEVPLVEDVCWHNLKWEQIKHRHGPLYLKRLQVAFDRVADKLRY